MLMPELSPNVSLPQQHVVSPGVKLHPLRIPDSKHLMSPDDTVRAMLTCPVCLELAPRPILQCKNGHTTCLECLSNGLSTCPQCRVELIPLTRNIELEERMSTVGVACSLEGCNKVVAHAELSNHLKCCPKRLCRCPLAASAHCAWRGCCDSVEKHIAVAHGAIRGTCGQIKVVRHKTKKLSESRRTHVLIFDKGDGGTFIAFMFCRRKTLYAYCQRISAGDDDADDFSWSLTFYGPDLIEARHSRRCSSRLLTFDKTIDPITTLAVPPPDDVFDLASNCRVAEVSLPLALEGNREAMALQATSKSMWCIAFRVHRIASKKLPFIHESLVPTTSTNAARQPTPGADSVFCSSVHAPSFMPATIACVFSAVADASGADHGIPEHDEDVSTPTTITRTMVPRSPLGTYNRLPDVL